MNDFLAYLDTIAFVEGEPLEKEAIIVAQKVLYNMGLDFIPASYVSFLRHHNGIKTNGCYLFGATVDDDLDIIDKNEQMARPENTIILGYNDFDLLVYNYVEKEYQIIDREDFELLDSYTDDGLYFALNDIFNG